MMKAYKVPRLGWIVVSEGRCLTFRFKTQAKAFLREERRRLSGRGPGF